MKNIIASIKLNKNNFVLISLSLSFLCAVIISGLIIPHLENALGEMIPIQIVAVCCAIGQITGTIYYLKKHKYAYGDNYEWYQIMNSSIYGIQNILRVLLVVALINICLKPLIILLCIIYGVIYLKKIFRM